MLAHVHTCPECYEHASCDLACSIETDLTLDDGTQRGGYAACEVCAPTTEIRRDLTPSNIALPFATTAQYAVLTDSCHGHHPPEWSGEHWICAQCRLPLDARMRGIASKVEWIGDWSLWPCARNEK